ncbi:Sbal_3080 family lipoprotein [Marinomonas atlantica]|uniref:Sbal_3080 family lipoprotein n=1 Tax=Marinomonas atlantica TaxID=1806668 RepID=UPI00082F252C|nr:Sbal_3080 family lipoprotein [Marinomonas atlantica]
MLKKQIFALIVASFLGGCANNAIVDLQKLQPSSIENKTIQVIDDGRTKDSIKNIIASKLDQYGFQYQVVDVTESNSDGTSNPKLSYSANWWWDLATYMRYLNVEIKDRNQTIALVKIDTVMCGGFDKFGSAQKRTEITLDLLLSDLSKEDANRLICLGS